MAKRDPQRWMDLCKAAAQTSDTGEFLRIVRELNETLETEQHLLSELQIDTGPKSSDEERRW